MSGTSNKCSGTVKLYQHEGFWGWTASFGRSDYNFNNFTRHARNDDASSIKVPPGCKAELYQHGGYGGWKAEFGPGNYDKGHFIKTGAVNNDASTIKVKDADDGSYITKGKGICDWHYTNAPRGPHSNQSRLARHDMASCAEACKKVPNCKRFSLSVHGCRLSKCGSDPGPRACPGDKQCPISTAHGGTWGELKGAQPIPAAPARPSSTTVELGGYTKHVNINTGAVNLTDKNGPVKFKGNELDGATMCNHYSNCTGFSYEVNNKEGNLKRGVDSHKFSQAGVNYYSKITSVTTPEGADWGGLTALVKKEAELQNTIGDGCWNCRSIIGWLGCNETGTASKNGHKHDDWVAKCNATCKSWNKKSWGKCKGTSAGGSKSDSVCGGRSWKECGDGGGAKCRGNSRINDINNPECVWVDKGPGPLSTPSINRRAGVRKTYYNEVKREYDALRPSYDKRKDVEIPEVTAARTTALATQNTDLKKQREDLEKRLNDKYSKLTKEHQEIIKELIKKSADLEKKRQQLDEEYRQLQIAFEEKKARIVQLQNEIKVETENASALTAAFKDELKRLQEDKKMDEERILVAKQKIQAEKIKIDNIINEINKKTIEYSDLLVKSRSHGEKIIGLEDIKTTTENNNDALAREITVAPSMLKIHNDALIELQADLDKYKENKNRNPVILVKLLNRKKKLMGQVFNENENKYNMNTDRIDRRHLIDSPANILLQNQKNELIQNKRKINILSKDLSSASKNTQMVNNEFKKRDYFIFILKYISVFILLLLLTSLLIKTGTVPTQLGYGLMVIITLVLILILVLNMYYNKNRNQMYFNKRDWSGVKIDSPGSKKCPKT